jgi:hypothetical protein
LKYETAFSHPFRLAIHWRRAGYHRAENGGLVGDRFRGVQFHALRTRQGGARRFISVHVLVPGDWTVLQGHQFLERLEASLCGVLPNSSVLTHLEALDDPASWDDPFSKRAEVRDAPPRWN